MLNVMLQCQRLALSFGLLAAFGARLQQSRQEDADSSNVSDDVWLDVWLQLFDGASLTRGPVL